MRDSNLYTLILRPKPPVLGSSPSSWIDTLELIEQRTEYNNKEEARYFRVRHRKEEGEKGLGYVAGLYDAYTSAKLASCSSPPGTPKGGKDKTKKLMLHSPDLEIFFESTGSMSFEWTFHFENQKFRWKRETFGGHDYTCYLDRKPDPSVELCIVKTPSKGRDGFIQLMEHNIERFEIQDPKGLEIAMFTSIISLLDMLDDKLSAREQGYRDQSSSSSSAAAAHASPSSSSGNPPPIPAKPKSPPPKPQRVISEEDWDDPNPNEVFVRAEGDAAQYASKCVGLLEDQSILFIIIKSKNAAAAGKAVEVADATKRARHRIGLDQDGPGLYQYVIEDVEEPKAGPKVIKLDDAPKSGTKSWKPPPNISVYLSKIELPDLSPSRRAAAAAAQSSLSNPLPVKSIYDRTPSGSNRLSVPAISPPLSGGSGSSSPGHSRNSSSSNILLRPSASNESNRTSASSASGGSRPGDEVDRVGSKFGRLFKK